MVAPCTRMDSRIPKRIDMSCDLDHASSFSSRSHLVLDAFCSMEKLFGQITTPVGI